MINVDKWFADIKAAVEEATKAYKVVTDCKAKALAAIRDGPAMLGGRLTLVDLAGADYDDRGLDETSKGELSESAKINEELFCLKNVMKELGGKKKRLDWRNSKLTMVLRGLMLPADGGSSLPVMIATFSPSS